VRRRTITIDPDTGALHESAHRLWLGPPKTPASARTITLPHFLAGLLHMHLAAHDGDFVFTSPLGYPLRRSTFDRRVFRPPVDGDIRNGTGPIRPGLTFHGLRHSHKTWLIADNIPEIAQARRLGHHLDNRLVETYSHVAPEIEHRLIRRLEHRWQSANRPPSRPPTPPRRAPHRTPARDTPPRRVSQSHDQPRSSRKTPAARAPQEARILLNPSTQVDGHTRATKSHAMSQHTKRALSSGETPEPRRPFQGWS
jgi:hypothetical protein